MNQIAFQKWAEAYRRFEKEGTILSWPSLTLVRMFMGNYIPGLDKNYNGKKVLDVGCGSGNNLIFAGTLGLDLYATEVAEDICDLAKERMSKFGFSIDIRVGFNTKLPFEDDFFDYLVSWNVVHYADNEEELKKTTAEYARVLKPGGRIFLSTTGPQHMILKDAEVIGSHLYQIGRKDDFRKGQVFFYFDNEYYLHFYFRPHFENTLTGRVRDFLFTEWQDYFIFTGTKK